MPQKTLDGRDSLDGIYDSNPTRREAREQDRTLDAWVRASKSLAAKAQAALNRGDVADAAVYRELAKIAANAREQRYIAVLRKMGRL